ncbi:MAG: hypothetical protein HYX28_02765 [Candidatus Koribacter versatilis]|uniref:Uncharacterized protein n=1 Tax=Candidatus Korobacter versatilis TaxID=658062 RepID=A0A932EPI5_9BACT|nr:hypothetical protein [Candidatus Koribacter versatilis]
MTRLKALLEVPLTTLAMTLREIFDENAYARFLARTGKPRSRASYQAFLDELRERDATRIRCC